ncbi:MAG: metallophosphoesterase family protein [Clostridia bacterium]|nr:metallophosphoesterase family protein [Clostridia bacterium]
MPKSLTFKDGRFKIMQIADAQEFPFVSPDTVRLIELALEAEKPDFVIFTGDQIYGIHPRLWGKDPEKTVGRVIEKLLSPVIKAGVPFAVTFGNHDAESGATVLSQAKLYSSFPGYVRGERRAEDDPGTFYIPVSGEDGREKFMLYAFDTHGSAYSKTKSGTTKKQLEWFVKTRDEAKKNVESAPPAIVFQHIPVPEYYNVIKEVKKGTKGAVEAFGSRKNRFFALPDEIISEGGFMKESPSVTGADTHEFDVLKEDGNVIAICAGHDHNNSFVSEYRGIKLIYTQGAGFHVYGPHLQRGVRLFVVDENAPEEITTYTRTWEGLTDEKPKERLLEELLSRTPSSVGQAKAYAKRLSPALAAGAAAAGGLVLIALKNKKR